MERPFGVSTKRKLMAGLVAGAMAASGMAVVTTPASQAQDATTLEDGEWAGRLSYNALAVFDDEIPASYWGRGGVTFGVSGGVVAGEFNLVIRTVVEPPDTVPAIATASVMGNIGGTSQVPELVYDTIDVVSSSQGIEIDLTFTAAELGNPTITLVPTDAVCGAASGFWNQEFEAGLTSQGQFIEGRQGTWSASRVGATGFNPGAGEILDDVEDQVGVLIDRLRAGEPLGPDQLSRILADAEALAAGGISRTECGAGGATAFRSQAVASILQLLEEAALSDTVFNEALVDLLIAGYRTGAFDADPELEQFYREAFVQIVEEAIRSASANELLRLYSAAIQLGADDLVQRIAIALETAL